jgi:hypothetical protein
MDLTFIQIEVFAAKWKRLKLTDEDLQALEQQLSQNPDAGVIMKGTGGLRKVRFAPPSWHTGKSGATRVCYVHVVRAEAVGLIAIFAKNEKENLSAEDKAFAAKVVKLFDETLASADDDDEKDKGKE